MRDSSFNPFSVVPFHITAEIPGGAADYVVSQEKIRVMPNTPLIKPSGIGFCLFSGIEPWPYVVEDEVVACAEVGGIQQTPDVLALVWKIGQACIERESLWQAGHFEDRGFDALICPPLGDNPFAWFTEALLLHRYPPKLNQKLQVVVLRNKAGKYEVLLGLSGQHFDALGPGPDALVDDSEDAYLVARVDYDLLPKELRQALPLPEIVAA